MSGFYLEKKIYYHDTDAGGVVYYGSYLRHLEEARTEYLRSLGIDYKSPARYGDIIRVFTRPKKVGNASLSFTQEIKRGEVTLAIGKVTWACVNRELKPTRIPEEIRSKIRPSLRGVPSEARDDEAI